MMSHVRNRIEIIVTFAEIIGKNSCTYGDPFPQGERRERDGAEKGNRNWSRKEMGKGKKYANREDSCSDVSGSERARAGDVAPSGLRCDPAQSIRIDCVSKAIKIEKNRRCSGRPVRAVESGHFCPTISEARFKSQTRSLRAVSNARRNQQKVLMAIIPTQTRTHEHKRAAPRGKNKEMRKTIE